MRDTSGALVGYVCVLSRSRLDAGEEERAVLRIFAARAAAELERRRHEAILRAREIEVTASRARLLHAADEERRRIGRDLHDGAQQRLVMLGQCLDLALRQAERDPRESARLMGLAREQARIAGSELRDLARGLHPAGLSANGLGPSLRALAVGAPIRLRLAALPEGRLPDPVEVTVYYLVAESLTNAAKHGGASELRVAVERRGRVPARRGRRRRRRRGGGGRGRRPRRPRRPRRGARRQARDRERARRRHAAARRRSRWRPGATAASRSSSSASRATTAPASARSRRSSAGAKTVSVSLAREWDLDGGPPRIGQRLPITDHHGARRCVVEVTRVAVLPFGQIDGAAVSADSAGTATLEEWMESHRAFYAGCRDEVALLLGEPGWRLTDAEPMVLTSFRLA